MLPTSHSSPILAKAVADGMPMRGEAMLLADAFSDFIAVSAKLERSYRDLQGEIAQLGLELAERNAALEESLLGKEQMQLALLAMVDSMPCGVLVLGRNLRVQRINAEGRRILTLDADEAQWSDLAVLGASLEVDLAQYARSEGEYEFSFPLKNGAGRLPARRWVALRTRCMAAESSDVQVIFILSDISAHKQAEQDREAGRRALAQAEVAATLAHEIRNPLASLELFVGLLEDEPGRVPEWAGHLRAGVRSLSATVNNVLSFHGAGFLPLRELVLADTIRDAVAFAQPVAEQAGIALTLWCAAPDSRVMANEAALQQVVLNLVANAVRHTPAGGSVAVSLTPADAATLLLTVTDTGSGIEARNLPRIFEPGWSASGASTGLGLAVCQRIAAQHGSVLTVSSVVGRGTAFEMELKTL